MGTEKERSKLLLEPTGVAVRKDATEVSWFFPVSRYLFGFKSPEGDLKPNILWGGSAPHPPSICRPPAASASDIYLAFSVLSVIHIS